LNNLSGKRVIVTGANSGLGFETVKSLAENGAHVILAVRNEKRGEVAKKLILKMNERASLEVMNLDLADLDNVREFTKTYNNRYNSLDLLINNAGVMTPPYQKTKDGFELQFGCNHLGHFALTGLMLTALKNTPDSRVVTLSSLAHKGASINFNNLDGSRGYWPMKFYGQSKLANLLFAKELDQRLTEHGISTKSIACHPGISATNLFKIGKWDSPVYIKFLQSLFFQPAKMGALPTIYAATEESLNGGEYIGPNGLGHVRGFPAIEKPASNVYNEATMKKLWEVSETLTGVTYDFSKTTYSNIG
jgi:NAD(P)-dependent dehydrogenase (short-subunit alcohol dehydrogenase family)